MDGVGDIPWNRRLLDYFFVCQADTVVFHLPAEPHADCRIRQSWAGLVGLSQLLRAYQSGTHAGAPAAPGQGFVPESKYDRDDASADSSGAAGPALPSGELAARALFEDRLGAVPAATPTNALAQGNLDPAVARRLLFNTVITEMSGQSIFVSALLFLDRTAGSLRALCLASHFPVFPLMQQLLAVVHALSLTDPAGTGAAASAAWDLLRQALAAPPAAEAGVLASLRLECRLPQQLVPPRLLPHIRFATRGHRPGYSGDSGVSGVSSVFPGGFPGVSDVPGGDLRLRLDLRYRFPVLKTPLQSALPVTVLFDSLSVETICACLGGLLAEGKVLLHSASQQRASAGALVLLQLLWPFAWPHTLVPCLPWDDFERSVAQSSGPFLVGMGSCAELHSLLAERRALVAAAGSSVPASSTTPSPPSSSSSSSAPVDNGDLVLVVDMDRNRLELLPLGTFEGSSSSSSSSSPPSASNGGSLGTGDQNASVGGGVNGGAAFRVSAALPRLPYSSHLRRTLQTLVQQHLNRAFDAACLGGSAALPSPGGVSVGAARLVGSDYETGSDQNDTAGETDPEGEDAGGLVRFQSTVYTALLHYWASVCNGFRQYTFWIRGSEPFCFAQGLQQRIRLRQARVSAADDAALLAFYHSSLWYSFLAEEDAALPGHAGPAGSPEGAWRLVHDYLDSGDPGLLEYICVAQRVNYQPFESLVLAAQPVRSSRTEQPPSAQSPEAAAETPTAKPQTQLNDGSASSISSSNDVGDANTPLARAEDDLEQNGDAAVPVSFWQRLVALGSDTSYHEYRRHSYHEDYPQGVYQPAVSSSTSSSSSSSSTSSTSTSLPRPNTPRFPIAPYLQPQPREAMRIVPPSFPPGSGQHQDTLDSPPEETLVWLVSLLGRGQVLSEQQLAWFGEQFRRERKTLRKKRPRVCGRCARNSAAAPGIDSLSSSAMATTAATVPATSYNSNARLNIAGSATDEAESEPQLSVPLSQALNAVLAQPIRSRHVPASSGTTPDSPLGPPQGVTDWPACCLSLPALFSLVRLARVALDEALAALAHEAASQGDQGVPQNETADSVSDSVASSACSCSSSAMASWAAGLVDSVGLLGAQFCAEEWLSERAWSASLLPLIEARETELEALRQAERSLARRPVRPKLPAKPVRPVSGTGGPVTAGTGSPVRPSTPGYQSPAQQSQSQSKSPVPPRSPFARLLSPLRSPAEASGAGPDSRKAVSKRSPLRNLFQSAGQTIGSPFGSAKNSNSNNNSNTNSSGGQHSPAHHTGGLGVAERSPEDELGLIRRRIDTVREELVQMYRRVFFNAPRQQAAPGVPLREWLQTSMAPAAVATAATGGGAQTGVVSGGSGGAGGGVVGGNGALEPAHYTFLQSCIAQHPVWTDKRYLAMSARRLLLDQHNHTLAPPAVRLPPVVVPLPPPLERPQLGEPRNFGLHARLVAACPACRLQLLPLGWAFDPPGLPEQLAELVGAAAASAETPAARALVARSGAWVLQTLHLQLHCGSPLWDARRRLVQLCHELGLPEAVPELLRNTSRRLQAQVEVEVAGGFVPKQPGTQEEQDEESMSQERVAVVSASSGKVSPTPPDTAAVSQRPKEADSTAPPAAGGSGGGNLASEPAKPVESSHTDDAAAHEEQTLSQSAGVVIPEATVVDSQTPSVSSHNGSIISNDNESPNSSVLSAHQGGNMGKNSNSGPSAASPAAAGAPRGRAFFKRQANRPTPMDPNWKPQPSQSPAQQSQSHFAPAAAASVELPPYEDEGPPSCLTERDYIIRAVMLAGERWLLNRAGLLIYSGNGTVIEVETEGLP